MEEEGAKWSYFTAPLLGHASLLTATAVGAIDGTSPARPRYVHLGTTRPRKPPPPGCASSR
ncbi:hypothetical protein E2C01_082741 [Portunus trituberculatus]|uniref:Uncharacterized protein n=1 Tax=Portunus trituberculatus TaxID=210409 RepID=A0A5B7IVD0_PORTR|nr:hypothetical protein [Portunus trituberculatus]